MAITHPTAQRNKLVDADVDSLDLGSGTSAGRLRIKTAADALLVALPLSNPAFGAAAGGVATANAVTQTAATAAGTAAKYDAVDRDGNVIWSGVVSAPAGGGDLVLTNTSIALNDPISVSSWTHTGPA